MMPQAGLRVATPADIPALLDVRTSVRENHLNFEQLAERGVTPDAIAEMLDGDARTWVVEEDDRIVGFSVGDARTGTVFALFVRPDAEGKGYGRALLGVAEEWLFAAGWETIWLQTGEDSDNRAHGFYVQAGWELAGPASHGDVRYEKRSPE